jgi:uncharacterized protein
LATLGAGAAQAIPPPPPQPLFLDCSQTVFVTETFMCDDDALIARDRALGDLYAVAAQGLSPQDLNALEADQRAWTTQRNRCAFKADQRRCVVKAYDARTRSLRARIRSTGR